uniref:Charged multivesicular body protein 3 n=1 Tax=Tetraodon nigroviridis TaxID=99883 RepID=H3DJ03_TETNG
MCGSRKGDGSVKTSGLKAVRIQGPYELCRARDEESACKRVYFVAVVRVAGALQKSTDVMKAMQSLVKVPEIQATMRELSKEMMKAGIIEEMLEDTFESMEDGEEMEEAAEEEIDKILFELTAGALGKAPSKVTDALPEMEPQGATAASDEESEEDIEAMQSRLEALRS